LCPGTRLVEHQAVQQFVDHARIIDQDFREKLAAGAEIDIELEAGRVEAEELPKDRLGPERGGDFFQIDERQVGGGWLGDGAEEVGSNAGEKMAAAARG